MPLAALKPSFRKLGAATLIVFTAIIYSAIETAITKKTKNKMSEAFLGEPVLSKIKELQSLPCERDEKIIELSIKFAEANAGNAKNKSEDMMSTRNRMYALNFLILFILAYISACILLPTNKSNHAI